MRYLFFRLRLQMRLGLYWHRLQEPSPQPELLQRHQRRRTLVSTRRARLWGDDAPTSSGHRALPQSLV